VRSLTTLFDTRLESPPVALQLMVMGSDLFAAIPLPKNSSLTIGRADNADVHITDPLASRLHARLHLGEAGLIEIEDVGSINKTKVREVPLTPGERVAVLPGEAIMIGSTILMVQEMRVSARPRRVWPHTYFEARTEEECGRAAETRAPFVVTRLSVDPTGNASPGVVADTIAPALRPSDMLALYATSEYEILMPATPPELGVAIAQDLVSRLRAMGINARTGLASYPRDGQTPEALAARASERLRGIEKPVVAGDKVIVEDPRMRRLYQLARSAAAGVINVLIVGETGVGKDVMAEAIHRMSPRAKAPFLSLNCTAVSESLLESELFGHEKGAFTGATDAKAGLLETAPGGTVFLDEIGDMPMQLQAKLLRVIETRQISRVGSLKARAIDVRFVAATNRNLEADVAAGRFRRDLYYRLNGMLLQIPPLRERRNEIVPLARSFLTQFATQAGLPAAPPLSDEAARLLEAYPWQGNARELRNVMERALLLCDGAAILPEHLPLESMAANSISFAPNEAPAGGGPPVPAAAAAGTGDIDDRDYVMRVLNENGGNQSRAAKALGIARSTLIARLEAWGIPRPRK
jgi:DNA-binding NtrC family response regulator